jgi:hypothetical protein
MLQKTNPYLSKTAQSPQVVGAAGKTAFFFGTFFWASKRKYRCQAKVTNPGRKEQTFDWFNFYSQLAIENLTILMRDLILFGHQAPNSNCSRTN